MFDGGDFQVSIEIELRACHLGREGCDGFASCLPLLLLEPPVRHRAMTVLHVRHCILP